MANPLLEFFVRLKRPFSGKGWRRRSRLLNWSYQAIQRGLTPKESVVHGNMMKLDPLDSMGLAVNGTYEPYQTSLIEKWIKPGDTVLDLGANIGYYTLIYANLVGPNGKVFAIEPEPSSFALLSENVNRNHYENVTLMKKAVADHDGTMQLYKDSFSNLDHRLYASHDGEEASFTVDVIRLDSLRELKEAKVDLIKMDIQGAECLALKGMSHLLAKNPDLILISEFWPLGLERSGTPPEDYYGLLIQEAFTIFELRETENRIIQVQSAEQLLALCSTTPFYVNLACTKGKSTLDLRADLN